MLNKIEKDKSKKYVQKNMAFFAVKPGDENQLEIQWPEVPTSFSELGDLVIEFGSNTAETVGNLVYKAVDIVQQKEVKIK